MKSIAENKIIIWFLKILVTAVFIVAVNRNITGDDLRVIAGHIEPRFCALALLFSAAGLFFQVRRWGSILRHVRLSESVSVAWKTLLWGTLLAFVTPGRIGELFRGITIDTRRKGDSLFAVIVDKLCIVTTVLLTGAGGVCLQLLLTGTGLTRGMIIFLVAASAVCVASLALFLPGRRQGRAAGTHAVWRYVDRIRANLPRIVSPEGKNALLCSFGAHLCLMAQTVALLMMFGCGAVAVNGIAVAQAYGVMPFISLTIGNMGVREGVFHFFLSGLGVTCDAGALSLKAACLGTSVVIMCMNLVAPACVGLVWYLVEKPLVKKGSESG